MEASQISPKTQNQTDNGYGFIPYTELSPQQQMWVDYNVLQGVITEEDGKTYKLSQDDFASQIGVDRKTLYNWRKSIPNFDDLVAGRRKLLNKGNRLSKMWNALYLAGTQKLDVRAIQTWLANVDPDFRLPQQEVKHEVGNSWAALLDNKRQVIDGETTNASNTN